MGGHGRNKFWKRRGRRPRREGSPLPATTQQAAEIGLKALFILNGVDFEFTHSVVDSVAALGTTYRELSGFRREPAALTAYIITARYPDKLTGISPLEIKPEKNP